MVLVASSDDQDCDWCSQHAEVAIICTKDNYGKDDDDVPSAMLCKTCYAAWEEEQELDVPTDFPDKVDTPLRNCIDDCIPHLPRKRWKANILRQRGIHIFALEPMDEDGSHGSPASDAPTISSARRAPWIVTGAKQQRQMPLAIQELLQQQQQPQPKRKHRRTADAAGNTAGNSTQTLVQFEVSKVEATGEDWVKRVEQGDQSGQSQTQGDQSRQPQVKKDAEAPVVKPPAQAASKSSASRRAQAASASSGSATAAVATEPQFAPRTIRLKMSDLSCDSSNPETVNRLERPVAPTSSAALVPVPFADDSESSQVLYGPNGTPPGDSGSDGVSGAGGGVLADGQASTAAPLTADSFRRTPQGRKAVADALLRAAIFHVGQGRRVSGDDGFLLLPAVVQGVRNIKGLPGVTLEQLSQRTVVYFENHAFQKLTAKEYGAAVFRVIEGAQEDIAKFGSLLRRIFDSCPAGAFTVKKALLM